MNILFITHCTSVYGANSSMLNLIEVYKKCDINAYVLLPSYGDLELVKVLQEKNIPYLILPYKNDATSLDSVAIKRIVKPLRNRFFDWISLANAKCFVKKNNIDIIHSNSICVGFGAFLAKKMSIPHVWHLREYLDDDYNLAVTNDLFRKQSYGYTRKFIAISKSIKDKYSNVIQRNKIDLIYNGVKSSSEEVVKKKHDKFIFVIVGLVSENKGTLEAIEAFFKFSNAHPSAAELWVVGGGLEDKTELYAQRVLSKVDGKSAGCEIKLWGKRSDVGELLNQCDCGLMCSKKEAFGRVTIEYMQHKLLVIGSNSGGTPEIIDDGTTGFLYEPGNVNALTEKMEYVYLNREKLDNMIDTAYQKAIGYFSIERCANEIIDLYNEVAQKGDNTK